MLQSFKDRIRGSRWLGYTIVAVISVPFALWGIQAYVGGGSSSAAVEVNGEEIPERVVERQVAQQRRALSERFNGELPDAFSDQMLRRQVIDRMIRTRVLEHAAAQAGMRATPEAIADEVRATDAFQQDGGFNRERYRQVLQRSGMTPAQYETRVGQSVQVQQLQQGVAASAFVLRSEARRLARLSGQERHVRVLRHPRDAARAQVELDDAAIRQYYEANKDQFRAPEQVRLAYIELDLEGLRQQVEVSEEALRREYEAAGERYREAAARRAAHILIEVPEDADEAAVAAARQRARELRQRVLEQGTEFAELAREYSDDSGSAKQGGDLGFVTRGMMVEAFEKTLFELPRAGAVSEPVRTRYGFHLVKLKKIREREQKPFPAVRDQIEQELRTRRAENRFYERVEVLKNTAFENPDGLEAVANATGLEIRASDWISRRSGDGIGSHEAVRRAAFSKKVLQQRRNSDVIELGKRRVAVIRATEYRESRPRPLTAVEDRVRSKLLERRTEQRLQQWSERALEQLRANADPDSLARDGVVLERHGWIGSSASDVDQAVLRSAFDQPAPTEGGNSYAATDLSDGARGVIVVGGVRIPEVGSDQVRQTRESRRRQLSQAEFRAWVTALRQAADIQRFEGDGVGDQAGQEGGGQGGG